MRLRDIRKISVTGKRVLVRVDYNVETSKAGRPRDLTRFEATLPTLQWLLKHGASVILLAHRGRPTGRQANLSLRPFVPIVNRMLKSRVIWLPQPLGSRQLLAKVKTLQPGQVALLENLRFDPGEARNSPRTIGRLAALGDVYINDAFADSHRPAASIVGLAKQLPSAAGLQLQREIKHLTPLLKHSVHPYVAIIGGAKISTKLGLVRKLLKTADHVLLGGALANTVLQAEGQAIGKSLSEPGMLRFAKGLTIKNKKLHIPCDVQVWSSGRSAVRAVAEIQPHERVVDIGPDTVDLFTRVIRQARTIVWNGPMGWYEHRPYDRGTKAMARAIARSRAISVVGGGETVDAIRSQGLQKKFTFVSTGGGAMLEFLEGKSLPGVRVLSL